jgi:hypothetical protein
MYASEKVFIMQFIAWLKKLGVNEIPYDKVNFENGAENMQTYFHDNRAQLGEYSHELAMLFLKNSLEGSYYEFRKAIEYQNGSLMSFDNPHYVHAKINLDKDGAEFILNQENKYISGEHIRRFSEAFIKGAGIYPEK